MADFLDVDITTDPDELKQRIIDAMQTSFPSWQPNPGSWEDVFSEAVAMVASDTRDISAQVPKAVFREFGSKLAGLPPQEAATAVTFATVTAVDNTGYTIPAGTEWGLIGLDGEPMGFSVVSDVVIPPGATATDAGEVSLVAVDEGSAYNGLSGDVEQLDTLAFIATIAVTAPTAGGLDAEDDDDYLDRLARELRLLAPRPILPADFATMYRRIAGVHRALAIDLYDPNTDTYDNERTITLVGLDESGQGVGSPVKSAGVAYLEERREVNFQVFTMDPNYTTILVNFEATCYDNFVAADVEAATIAAVTEYLSPATWGDTPYGEDAEWIERTHVRYLEIASVINAVTGIDEIQLLEIKKTGGTFGQTDITMDGPAALPEPGAITGDVTVA